MICAQLFNQLPGLLARATDELPVAEPVAVKSAYYLESFGLLGNIQSSGQERLTAIPTTKAFDCVVPQNR